MNVGELIEQLSRMPQELEVGTPEGMVISVDISSYDDNKGTHEYVNLEIDEE